MPKKLLNIYFLFISLITLTAVFIVPTDIYSQQPIIATGINSFVPFNHQSFLSDKDGINFANLTIAEVSSDKRFSVTVNDDTTGNGENRISRILYSQRGDEITVEVELAEQNQSITIALYNLLGKSVIDPHSYFQSSGKNQYVLNVSGLPNGVYLCTVTGRNFRLREKIMISR